MGSSSKARSRRRPRRWDRPNRNCGDSLSSDRNSQRKNVPRLDKRSFRKFPGPFPRELLRLRPAARRRHFSRPVQSSPALRRRGESLSRMICPNVLESLAVRSSMKIACDRFSQTSGGHPCDISSGDDDHLLVSDEWLEWWRVAYRTAGTEFTAPRAMIAA